MDAHTTDSDCQLDLDGTCTSCGVTHNQECSECGGHGFHREGCSEVEDAR